MSSRHARPHAPGSVVHVIARFVDNEYRLATTADRRCALEHIPEALRRSGWSLHAHALMSSHIHLAMSAGDAPPAVFLGSWLTSVARRLNKRHGRRGPVFSGRATTILLPRARLGVLVRYIHNNPVRAGVVDDAAASDWTSHRIWIGDAPCPSWLSIDDALFDAGFTPSRVGRRLFDQHVRDYAHEPRDITLSGPDLPALRTRTRRGLALPVELGSADHREGAPRVEIRYCGNLPVLPRWDGALDTLVEAAAQAMDLPVELLRSDSIRRDVVEARRLVAVTGAWLLRRRNREISAALTVDDSTVSRLLRDGERVLEQAQTLAGVLRGTPDR